MSLSAKALARRVEFILRRAETERTNVTYSHLDDKTLHRIGEMRGAQAAARVVQRSQRTFCEATHPDDPRVVCHVRRGDGPTGHNPTDYWPREMGYTSPVPHVGFTSSGVPVAWLDPVPPERPFPGVNGRMRRPSPQRAIEAGS